MELLAVYGPVEPMSSLPPYPGGITTFPPPPAPVAPPAPQTNTAQACPPGQKWSPREQQCVSSGTKPGPWPSNHPTGPAAPPTPATQCPPGEVPKSNGQGCKPAGQWFDESEDELSKAGKETCDPMAHPGIQNGQYDCYWCDFSDRQWKRGYCPGGGAGGAGGGGGGGAARASSGPPIGPGAGSTGFSALLEQIMRDTLASPSRYTPGALQGMYGEITRQASGQIERGERAVRADAARRGMSRAGSTGAALRAVQAGAEAQRGQSIVGVQTEKIRADFADKMAGLDRAQRYLDSLRDNEYRYMLASEQRRQFDANLALGYANLSQQRSMLQMQLQSSWDMLRANQGFWMLTQGV